MIGDTDPPLIQVDWKPQMMVSIKIVMDTMPLDVAMFLICRTHGEMVGMALL